MTQTPPKAASAVLSGGSSPLSEAIPTSLDELFSIPPKDLCSPAGRSSRDAIVRELRAQRQRFLEAAASGAAVPRVKRVSTTKPKVDISYDELMGGGDGS